MSTEVKKMTLSISPKNVNNQQTSNFPTNLYPIIVQEGSLPKIRNVNFFEPEKLNQESIDEIHRKSACFNQKNYNDKKEIFVQIARLPTINERLRQTILASLSKVFDDNKVDPVIIDFLIEKWCDELSTAISLNPEYLNKNLLSIRSKNII